MDQPFHIILTYTYFFNSTSIPDSNLESINNSNIDNMIIQLIKLNNVINDKERIRPFIKDFYNSLSPERVQRLLPLIKANHKLTSSLVISTLIIDLLNLTNNNGTCSEGENGNTADILFDLLLIYNERQYRETEIGTKEDTHEVVWQILLQQDINGNNGASYARTGISKQAIFIEFLKKNLSNSFDAFAEELLSKIGVKSFTEYILLYIGLQIESERVANNSIPLVVIPPTDPRYPILHSLNLITDINAKQISYDLAYIVLHPLLKLSDGNLYLLGTHDFSLITEKGWEYYLFKQPSTKKYFPNIKNDNQRLSFIGKNYIEQFLMLGLLKAQIKRGVRVLDSDDQKLPDATMIVNEREIFIFEIKSSSLHYNIWINRNVEGFKNFIDDNFVVGKKGVSQLVRSLQFLKSEKEIFNIETPLKKLRIYPIIIYTEPHLNNAGVNDYIINKSKQLSEELTNTFSEILPVTMISYNFFLENHKLLNGDKLLLKRMIKNYHSSVSRRKKKYQKLNTSNNYIKAMISFDNYIIKQDGAYTMDKDSIFQGLTTIFRLDK